MSSESSTDSFKGPRDYKAKSRVKNSNSLNNFQRSCQLKPWLILVILNVVIIAVLAAIDIFSGAKFGNAKGGFNQTCIQDSDCDTKFGLICSSGKCSCDRFEIYNGSQCINSSSNDDIKTKILKKQFGKIRKQFETTLEHSISDYFVKKMNEATYIKDLESLEKSLNQIGKDLQKVKLVPFYLPNTIRTVLEGNKYEIETMKNVSKNAISVLPKNNKTRFENINILKLHLNSKVKELIDELSKYKDELNSNSLNGGDYIQYTHFINVSSVLNQLRNVKSLNSISIYATHSVIFDVDVLLDKKPSINGHGVDLYIIAPKIIVTKPITVDLSCSSIPGYPDDKKKANNGIMPGDNGIDGKPGLPGYNGGSFVILTNELVFDTRELNYTHKNVSMKETIDKHIKFISKGGRGGPGQEGGNGLEGKNGSKNYGNIRQFSKDKCHPSSYWVTTYEARKENNFVAFSENIQGLIGEKGGNAGRGGIGGIGGYNGKMTLIELATKMYIVKRQDAWRYYGSSGTSGLPGLGGFCSNTLYVTYRLRFCHMISRMPYYSYDDYYLTEEAPSTSCRGVQGSKFNDQNTVGWQKPKAIESISFYKKETEYLEFLSNISHKFKNSHFLYRDFTKKIVDNNYSKPDLFDVIKRAQILSNYKYHGLFKSFRNKISNYYHSLNFGNGEKAVLRYINAAIISIECRYNAAKETVLVVNIEKFLQTTIEQVRNWKTSVYQNIRNIYKNDYEANIKAKIEEANKLVNLLQSDLESNQQEVHHNIANIVKEIETLKEKLEENDIQLRKKKEKLIETIRTKQMFSILNIGCNVLTLFGPKAALVGGLAQTGLGIASKFMLPSDDETSIEIPTGVLEKYQSHLEKLEKKNSDDKEKREKNKDELKSKLEENDSNTKLEKVEKIFEIVGSIGDFLNEMELNDNEIKSLDETIVQNFNVFKGYTKIQNQIEKFQEKMLKETNNELNELIKSLNQSSNTNIEFGKWKVKEMLNTLKGFMNDLISELDTKSEFYNTMNRIESTINTILDIYNHIDNYIQQNQLANFIHVTAQPEFSIGIPFEYQAQINSFKQIIEANIIKERYEQAVESFSYFSFPFFCEFNTKVDINTDSNDINEITSKYADTLQGYLESVTDYETLLKPLHNHIETFTFDQESPFYQWSSFSYPFEIRQLLNGEKTTFYADIDSAHYDAIKFFLVYIRFEVKSKTLNEELHKVLYNFNVELTHSGESYYKFKNHTYKITVGYNGEKIKLKYRYGDKFEDSNETFKRLALLSPYTFWEIRLVPIKTVNASQVLHKLNSLLTYNTEVLVQLCGKGKFVSDEYIPKSCDNTPMHHSKLVQVMQKYSKIQQD